MAEQKVELRRIRDFSEIINDTFAFIRQNLKPLMTAFVGIAGVFMLSSAIVGGLYQNSMGTFFTELMSGSKRPSDTGVFDLFNGTYFLLIILGLLNFSAMKVTVIAYMKIYDEKGGETPTMNEVWTVFKYYFLKVFIFSLPIMILIAFGYILCLAPGFWLWVVLVPFEMLIMVENRSFSDAFSRCFSLANKNFWMSFGIYVIAYMIYYFASLIIGMMVGLVGGLFSYLTTKDIASTLAVVTSILTIFSQLFFVVYLVTATLNYYNLTERFEGTGMLKKLDTFGNRAADRNHPEEQY